MVIASAVWSRRSVLAGGAGLLVFTVAGCSQIRTPSGSQPVPLDEQAVARAVSQARLLQADALTLISAGASPRLTRILRAVADDHATHLAALGATDPASTDPASTDPAPAGSPPNDPASAGSASAGSASAVSVAAGRASSGSTDGGAAGGPAEPVPSSPSASAPPARPPSTAGQVAGEWAAAREALRDAGHADDAGLAVLLARIAAARAVHADLVGTAIGRRALPALTPAPALAPAPGATSTATPLPTATTDSAATGSGAADGTGALPADAARAAAEDGTASPTDTSGTAGPDQVSVQAGTPDTPWLKALDRLLAGEHAAVFAYPLIIAQLTGTSRAQAEQGWLDHQAQRNQLTQILVDAQVQPSPSAPAYDIGARLSAPAAARRLAGTLELGLARLAADAVAAARGTKQRGYAANFLVLSARHAAAWTGQPVALPRTSGSPSPATPETAAPSGTTPAASPSATAPAPTAPVTTAPAPTAPAVTITPAPVPTAPGTPSRWGVSLHPPS